MIQIIHFRSNIEGSHPNNGIYRQNHGQGSEIRSIRNYTIGDDPRDIVWHRGVGTDTLYTKDRESVEHPSVCFLSLIHDKGRFFSTDIYTRTKADFSTELEQSLIETSKKMRFPHKIIDTPEGIYEKIGRKNIVIVLADLESSQSIDMLSEISEYNDVIYLLLLHPTEIYPDDTGLIFESKKIQKDYYDFVREYIEKLSHDAKRKNISLLTCTTEDVPYLFLNHFFKYRYV